jgi:hypothetical protein
MLCIFFASMATIFRAVDLETLNLPQVQITLRR